MNQFADIIPISLFKKDTAEYLSKVELTDAPILLTLHGRGAFVLQHANSFMRNNGLAGMGRHSVALNGMHRQDAGRAVRENQVSETKLEGQASRAMTKKHGRKI